MTTGTRPEKPSRARSWPFNDKEYLLTDPVFLLGNGKSRLIFDLERIRPKGTIIGCNALYRDFAPDILVAIDAKMLNELAESKYCDSHTCLIPGARSIDIPSVLRWKTEKFNTSGCFAMKLITELMQPDKCYMLGMDAYPGNVYDKTINYHANTLQNFNGVTSYYIKVLNMPSDTVFINVNDKDTWPKEAHDTGRYEFMTYETFENVLEALPLKD